MTNPEIRPQYHHIITPLTVIYFHYIFPSSGPVLPILRLAGERLATVTGFFVGIMKHYSSNIDCLLCGNPASVMYGRGACRECASLIILDYEYSHSGQIPRHTTPYTISLWESLFEEQIRYHKPTQTKRKKRPPSLDLAVFSKDGYACRKCKNKGELTVDHIKPVALGGGDEIENLQTLCKRCNSSKGKKLIETREVGA